MISIPPHFIVEREKKAVFLIKGALPRHLILEYYMPYFPNMLKGIVMRCEESFFKMRMIANSKG